MKNRIYLDHHSATSVFPSALEKMNTFYRDPWVESSLSFQQLSNEILKSLGDGGDSVFHFSSSGAEAINSAFCSHYFDTLRSSGQNHILTSQLENAPIFFSIQRLEELGCTAKLLYPNEQGQITKQMLLAAIKPRTGLLSISWAQGLTGVIHPLADLAEVCREKDVALHVDATYALGKIYFCLKDLPIDFLTFDGQLLHAPHGTGGIICKKESPLFCFDCRAKFPPNGSNASSLPCIFRKSAI